MKADAVAIWEVVPDDATLHALTEAVEVGEWVAVAVPSLRDPALVLSAVWRDGRVWAFINKRASVGVLTFVKSVRAFHDVLRESDVPCVHGLRAEGVPARWMEWLGAVRTDETFNGQEVWVWLSSPQ